MARDVAPGFPGAIFEGTFILAYHEPETLVAFGPVAIGECGPAKVGVISAVPIHNCAVNSPADHVFDLTICLSRVVGVVAHVDVFLSFEEEGNDSSVDFSSVPGI